MLIYHGNVEKLKQEIAEHEGKIRLIYKKVLGEGALKKIESAAASLITPRSFLQLDLVEKYTGIKARHPAPNKFLLVTPKEAKIRINKHGKIDASEIRTAPAFIFSEEGFEHSPHEPKYLASYIHEFNHFIFYVLQYPPVFVAMEILNSFLKPRAIPLDLVAYIEDILSSPKNKENKILHIRLAILLDQLYCVYEAATRLLDKLIFEDLGYKYELPFERGRKPQMFLMELKELKTVLMLRVMWSGDPFYKISSDFEAIHTALDGIDCIKTADSITQNFIETMKRCKVQKVPIELL